LRRARGDNVGDMPSAVCLETVACGGCLAGAGVAYFQPKAREQALKLCSAPCACCPSVADKLMDLSTDPRQVGKDLLKQLAESMMPIRPDLMGEAHKHIHAVFKEHLEKQGFASLHGPEGKKKLEGIEPEISENVLGKLTGWMDGACLEIKKFLVDNCGLKDDGSEVSDLGLQQKPPESLAKHIQKQVWKFLMKFHEIFTALMCGAEDAATAAKHMASAISVVGKHVLQTMKDSELQNTLISWVKSVMAMFGKALTAVGNLTKVILEKILKLMEMIETKLKNAITVSTDKVKSLIKDPLLLVQFKLATSSVLDSFKEQTDKAKADLKNDQSNLQADVSKATGHIKKGIEAGHISAATLDLGEAKDFMLFNKLSMWIHSVVTSCKAKFTDQLHEMLNSDEFKDKAAEILSKVGACIPVVGGVITVGVAVWSHMRSRKPTKEDEHKDEHKDPKKEAHLKQLDVVFKKIHELCEKDSAFAADFKDAGLDTAMTNAMVAAMQGGPGVDAELKRVTESVQLCLTTAMAQQTFEMRKQIQEMDAHGPAMLIKNEELRDLWKKYFSKNSQAAVDAFVEVLAEECGEAISQGSVDVKAVCQNIDRDGSGDIDALELNAIFPADMSLTDGLIAFSRRVSESRASAAVKLPPRLESFCGREEDIQQLIKMFERKSLCIMEEWPQLRLVQVVAGVSIPAKEITDESCYNNRLINKDVLNQFGRIEIALRAEVPVKRHTGGVVDSSSAAIGVGGSVATSTLEIPPLAQIILPKCKSGLDTRFSSQNFVEAVRIMAKTSGLLLSFPQGGYGKSSVVIETAHRIAAAGHFVGGVRFYDVRGIRDTAVLLGIIRSQMAASDGARHEDKEKESKEEDHSDKEDDKKSAGAERPDAEAVDPTWKKEVVISGAGTKSVNGIYYLLPKGKGSEKPVYELLNRKHKVQFSQKDDAWVVASPDQADALYKAASCNGQTVPIDAGWSVLRNAKEPAPTLWEPERMAKLGSRGSDYDTDLKEVCDYIAKDGRFLLMIDNAEDLLTHDVDKFLHALHILAAKARKITGKKKEECPSIVCLTSRSVITEGRVEHGYRRWVDQRPAKRSARRPMEAGNSHVFAIQPLSKDDASSVLQKLSSKLGSDRAFVKKDLNAEEYRCTNTEFVDEVGQLPLACNLARLCSLSSSLLPSALSQYMKSKRAEWQVHDVHLLEGDQIRHMNTVTSGEAPQAFTHHDKMTVVFKVVVGNLTIEQRDVLNDLALIPVDFDKRLASAMAAGNDVALKRLLWGESSVDLLTNSIATPEVLTPLVDAGLVIFNRTMQRYAVHHEVKCYLLCQWNFAMVRALSDKFHVHVGLGDMGDDKFNQQLTPVVAPKDLKIVEFGTKFGKNLGCVYGDRVKEGKMSGDIEGHIVTWKVDDDMRKYVLASESSGGVICSKVFYIGATRYYLSLECTKNIATYTFNAKLPLIVATLRQVDHRDKEMGYLVCENGDSKLPLSCIKAQIEPGSGISSLISEKLDLVTAYVVRGHDFLGFEPPRTIGETVGKQQVTRAVQNRYAFNALRQFYRWHTNMSLGFNDPEMRKAWEVAETPGLGRWNAEREHPLHSVVTSLSASPSDVLQLNKTSCRFEGNNYLNATPLLMAIREEHWEMVRVLLQTPRGRAMIPVPDFMGDRPKEMFCMKSGTTTKEWDDHKARCFADVHDVLSKEWDDHKAGWSEKTKNFLQAVSEGSEQKVQHLTDTDEHLKELEANVSKLNDAGQNVLHLCCKLGDSKAVAKLLKVDHSKWSEAASKVDEAGRLPLHYACEYGNYNMVQALLATPRLGAAIVPMAVKDVSGFTPLILACRAQFPTGEHMHHKVLKGCTEAVKICTSHPDFGFAIAEKSKRSYTPLWYASRCGHDLQVFHLLMNRATWRTIRIQEAFGSDSAGREMNSTIKETLVKLDLLDQDIEKAFEEGKSQKPIPGEEEVLDDKLEKRAFEILAKFAELLQQQTCVCGSFVTSGTSKKCEICHRDAQMDPADKESTIDDWRPLFRRLFTWKVLKIKCDDTGGEAED